jgi:molybdopterin molybdotransferase
LRDFTAGQTGGKIVSANSVTLAALVRDAGAEPIDLGIARDTAESMREILGKATGCDLIITTAGISVGDHDHVRDAVVALGGEISFWKVRMRPGAPLAFGTLHGAPWIGLSGNPVSAVVTFEVFVKPAIRKMLGFSRLFPRKIRVALGEPIRLAAPLMHFLRVVITRLEDRSYVARLAGSQSSGVMTSLARANALLIVPGDRLELSAGEEYMALSLGDDLETATSLDLA